MGWSRRDKSDDDDWCWDRPEPATWATSVSSTDNLTYTGLLNADGLLIYRRNAFGFGAVDGLVCFEDDEAEGETPDDAFDELPETES